MTRLAWLAGLAGLVGCIGGTNDDECGEASCPGVKDTCTQGSNMTDPRPADAFDASAPAPVLTIEWDAGDGRGADLPDDYFDHASVVAPTDPELASLIASVEHVSSRAIEVRFEELSAYLAAHEGLRFTLEFPDRSKFIDCTHPGMNDRYLLDVELVLDASNTLASSTLTESVQLGPI